MPKLIGINAIFEEYRGASDDSLLYLSIKNAGNVILISNLADNRLINSDSAFLEASIAQGLLDYEFNDEKVLAKYRNYIFWNNKVWWSFPVTMISYYDIEGAEEIMKTTIRRN